MTAPAQARPPEERAPAVLLALLLCFYVVLLLRTAWMAEDAYITFRSIDNLLAGYGLRWNVAERVQTFTHPLWLLLLTPVYLLTREFYLTVTLLTVGISALTAYLLLRRLSRSPQNMLLAAAALFLSKAFVDYSTSGLENPLTHLLLVLFLLQYYAEESPTPRRALLLSLIATLGVLNRMDTALLFAPPLLYVLLRAPRSFARLRAVALGTVPFFAWEAFAVIYYGFPFPNTAYAKLSTGLHPTELWEQGMFYVLNSLSWDPLTLFTISAAALYAFAFRRRTNRHAVLGVGVLLYVYYTLKIGGDFMTGRFFAAPLLCAAALLARNLRLSRQHAVPAFVVVALLAYMGKRPPFKTDESYKEGVITKQGIADERGFYFPASGLLNGSRSKTLPDHAYGRTGPGLRDSGRRFSLESNIGYMGYFLGPQMHLMDKAALCDPLRARMPVDSTKGAWRVGHFVRLVPAGYRQAVLGADSIASPSLKRYWQKLSLLTRGTPLLSWQRIKTIWNFNVGFYEPLLDHYLQAEYFVLTPQQGATRVEPGTDWDAPGNHLLNRHGVGIAIDHKAAQGRILELSLNGGHDYKLRFLRQGQVVHEHPLLVAEGYPRGLVVRYVPIPAQAMRAQFDRLRVVPAGRPRRHSVGHIRLLPALVVRALADLAQAPPRGSAWDRPGNTQLRGKALLVQLAAPSHARRIEISADNKDRYRICYVDQDREVGATVLPRVVRGRKGMEHHQLAVPLHASRAGFDRLVVEPLSGDDLDAVGHVLLR